MTMQDDDVDGVTRKFIELHCADCDKYLGFRDTNHQFFPNDFFCSLKCIDNHLTKKKITGFQIEHLKKK